MSDEATMDKEMLIRWIVDSLRRTMIHYGLWFREVEHQFGLDFALAVEREAGDLSIQLMLNRLAKSFGFEMEDNLPAALRRLDEPTLNAVMDACAANWLANDGVWFQAVEKKISMYDAKRANDTCWSRFSPVEASRIKVLAGLPDNGGLEALKVALQWRLYARLNKQEIVDLGPNAFEFRMVDCRVQSTRRRKKMEEYPCKSAGIVEYRSFATAVDPRITTECVGCPPDDHPDDWFCAWRFRME